MAALRAGKHVLVEKPMTSTVRTVDSRSSTRPHKRGLVLMVDHTFVYTSAVDKIRELTQSGDLGEIYYYDSVRINLGLFQHDVNVLWDLAVHDLSIMDYVLATDAGGGLGDRAGARAGQPENIAYMTMFFDGSLIAHVHVNWLAPVKVRRTLLGGSRRMIVFDDLEASEKIKVYDRGISREPEPGKRLPDDGRLSRWRHVGPAAAASPRRCTRRPDTSSTASRSARRQRRTDTPACASCGCSRPRRSRWRSRARWFRWVRRRRLS